MRSLWDDREAAGYVGDLAQRVYTARLLGREKSLISLGGGGTSVKIREKNLFGEEEDILYVSGLDRDMGNIETDGFSPLRLNHLIRLVKLDSLSDTQLADEIESHKPDASALAVSLEALLHAVLPHKYVDHVQADAVLAIVNTPGGLERVREVYGDSVVVVPYARTGLPLAKLCAEAFSSGVGENVVGVVLMQQGIVSFGETARVSYERMVDLVARAEQYLVEREARPVSTPTAAAPDRPVRRELAALRQAVSASVGYPVIMSTHTDPLSLSFARRDDVASISQQGPATPGHVIHTKGVPLLGRDVPAFGAAYQAYFAAHAANAGRALTMRDPAPRVILDPEFGMCAIGRTAKEATIVGDAYRHTMEVILTAAALEAYRSLPARDLFDVEYAELEQTGLQGQGELPMFAGEVALVTGAASGIGKACVESFLARGAAVVGLDMNPGIVHMFDRDDFLGVYCDVTDEDGVCQALETAVRTFGGLDILFLNAGIFPPSCPIESLQVSDWHKPLRVIVDANVVLMREAHPLLKASPRYGRVVIMGSQRHLAPGPGTVAYSASKAALVQLARVAALEWGKDGIRVNIINPGRVFGTGVFTEDVLRERAEYYGITVEEYKKDNLLRVEITSRDVGELAAEMCGPLFARSTGLQVLIDGGSDRLI